MEKVALISDLQLAEVSRMSYIYERASSELQVDRDVALVMVRKGGLFLEDIQTFQDDKTVVLAAVENCSGALQHASDRLKDDRDVVMAAVTRGGYAIRYASERLKSDREIALIATKSTGGALRYCDPKFRSDREFAIAAVSMQESRLDVSLEHLSDDLKNDREIVLLAVQNSGREIEHAPVQLVKYDREIILTAVKTFGRALGYASGHLPEPKRMDPFHGMCGGDYRRYERWAIENPMPVPPASQIESSLANDREIVLAAVTEDARAFEYASKTLQNDKEIAIEAVKKSSLALKYASKELQDDYDVVLSSVISDGDTLKYASDRLRKIEGIVATAMACCSIRLGSDLKPHFKPLEAAALNVFDNEETALIALAKSGIGGYYISDRLREDRDFVLKAVNIHGEALGIVDPKFRSDAEVVTTAVAQSGSALGYASTEIRNSLEMQKMTVTTSPLSICDIPKDTPHYKDVVLAAISVDGKALKYVFGGILNDDRDFILKAVQVEGENTKNNNRVLELASRRLKDDREVVLAAVKRKPRSFRHASARLRNDPEIALLAAEGSSYLTSCGFGAASSELRANKAIVLEAIKKNPNSIGCASKELLGDHDVVMAAVATDGRHLECASKELQSDREVVKAAVSTCGTALRWADPSFRADRVIVLRAVGNDPAALQFASPELRADPLIVNKVIEKDAAAVQWANIKDLIVLAQRSQPDQSKKESLKQVRNEKDILRDAFKKDNFALKKASAAMQDDEEMVLEALKFNYQNFKCTSERLRKKKSVALAAVEASHSNIYQIPRELLMERAFLGELAKSARKGFLNDVVMKKQK